MYTTVWCLGISCINIFSVVHFHSQPRTLSREPVWHVDLQVNGHFNNCLAIADTLLSDPRRHDTRHICYLHLRDR